MVRDDSSGVDAEGPGHGEENPGLPVSGRLDMHTIHEASSHANDQDRNMVLLKTPIASDPVMPEKQPIPGLHVRVPTENLSPQPKPRTSTSSSSSSSHSGSSEDDLDEISEYLRRDYRPATLRNSVDPNDDLADLTPEVFPMNVDCSLVITFNGQRHLVEVDGKRHDGLHVFSRFEWYKEESYHEVFTHCKTVVDKIKDKLNAEFGFTEGHKVYLRRGSCRVTGSTDAKNYCPDFSTSEAVNLSQVTIAAGCRFISKYPLRLMRLSIYCDYGSALLEPPEGEAFLEVMKDQYNDKLEITPRTILGQDYISVADLDVLTTEEISNRLIDEDEDKSFTADDRRELKRQVADRLAHTLLAVCLFAGVPLNYFRHFLLDANHYYDDQRLPRPHVPNQCPDRTCKTRYHKALLKNMDKFFALKVADDRWFHERSDSEVVPISYVDNAQPLLGEGAYSQVFEVAIDPAYRAGKSLASDLSQTYALKIFGRGVRNGEKHRNAFKKEIRMLLYLAVYPHPHIMTHITSWEQRGTFYILYNKADCNLRTYMETTRGGNLGKKRTLWFLQQLRGLAEAIRKVHQLREPSSGKRPEILRRASKSPKNGRQSDHHLEYCTDGEANPKEKLDFKKKKKKKLGIVGYHHDVKPENILVFEQSNKSPMLKLSDFGAGKFSRPREQESSRGPSRARGTLTYFGPEYHPGMKCRMTRPFDIWALGCVYLEFLIWFLGMQESAVGTGKSLLSLRTYYSGPRRVGLDFFWQKNTSGYHATDAQSLAVPSEFALNEGVRGVLKRLETVYLKDIPALIRVTRIIGDLLRIQPRDRLNAVNLANKLDAILAQAEVDLNSASDGAGPYQAQFDLNMAESQRDSAQFEGVVPGTPSKAPREQHTYPPQMSKPQAPSEDISTVGTTSRRGSVHGLGSSDASDTEQNRGDKMKGWPKSLANDFRNHIPGSESFDSSVARDDLRISDDETKYGSPMPTAEEIMGRRQPSQEDKKEPWNAIGVRKSDTIP